jgi:oligosaccharyltransferase complex subunit beta
VVILYPFFAADDPAITLTEYGEYLYDHLIIFAPTVEEFGGLIDVPSILDFIDEGHNVLIAADSSVSDPIREIAEECGVEFDEEGSFVLDHFRALGSNFDHRTVSIDCSADTLLAVPTISGYKKPSDRRPVLFKGIGQTINEASGLNIAILRGYDTSYSANPDLPVKEVKAIGKDTILISALQARNNARVVFSGSLNFFSDRFATSVTDNQYLASEITKWTFKERGVLRATNISHHRVDEKDPPLLYTIKEEIVYSVQIEEYNGQIWVPFQSNNVQLEFSMLDPYLRIPLKSTTKTPGLYTATFTAPDVYGVFSFKVDYFELGYTSLSLKTIQSVRPFRHDEYPRFIKTAYPYYTSATIMLAGVFILFVFLLFSPYN